MNRTDSIFRSLAAYDDSMLEHFVDSLRRILTTAQNRTISRAQRELAITSGIIDRTKGNSRFLRGIAARLVKDANSAGLGTMVEAFSDTFDGSLRYMQDIVEIIRESVKTPLPELTITKGDIAIGDAMKLNAITSIEDTVALAASRTAQRALFAIGGLPFRELVDLLSEQLDQSVGRASTIAATSQSTFYRTISANQLERVEENNPDIELRYRYGGPDDKLTRGFCHRQLNRKNPLTRPEIEALDNHQLPNPWLTCGGYNCRHQWFLDIASFGEQTEQAA